MKWPRGRYNGRRIVGLTFKLKIDVLWWGWHFRNHFGTLVIVVGPLWLWIEQAFEEKQR